MFAFKESTPLKINKSSLLIGVLILGLNWISQRAFALDVTNVSLSLGVLEETDDRLKTIVGLAATASNDVDVHYYYHSHAFGPVFESLHLVSFTKSAAFSFLPAMRGFFGISVMQESTQIKDKTSNETSQNVGLNLGVTYCIFDMDSFFTNITWEAGLYPAGLNGLFFLVFGRKQIISLSFGKEL